MNIISNINFKGYLVPQGFSSTKIENCDVCKNNPPAWIETRGIGDLAEFRTTCENCHSEFLSKVDEVEIQSKIEDFSIYDQLPPENNEISPTERPAWMDDFIEEGRAGGSVSTLDQNEKEESDDFSDQTPLQEDKIEPENDIASWSAGFVKEALFGSNPEKWLEDQGAFTENEIEKTISTLGNLHTNTVGSIKLSAILCLNGVANRFKDKHRQVIEELQKFTNDLEDTVQNYAVETLNKIK